MRVNIHILRVLLKWQEVRKGIAMVYKRGAFRGELSWRLCWGVRNLYKDYRWEDSRYMAREQACAEIGLIIKKIVLIIFSIIVKIMFIIQWNQIWHNYWREPLFAAKSTKQSAVANLVALVIYWKTAQRKEWNMYNLHLKEPSQHRI